MLNERPWKPNDILERLTQLGNWLVQPRSDLAPDRMRRARLFNILLLTEFTILIMATPVILVNHTINRIAIGVVIFLVGVALSYVSSRYGQVNWAAWANGLGALVALAYYIASSPRENSENVYLDFRSSVMLLALPIIVIGVVTGLKACMAFTGLGIICFIVVGIVVVPDDKGIGPDSGFVFYLAMFITPLSFLALTSLLAVVFERNIFGLFDRLNRRNSSLQLTAERLALKRQKSEQLTTELEGLLVKLKSAFDTQLHSADEQQLALVDAGASLEELGRVARRIDGLAGQASRVAGNAVAVANQEADVIMTNSAAYGRLQQHLDLINHSVEELTIEARNIDYAVSSISEVAEETNLLALNASIEAAGNREQGRRFNTIASEVQRLAARSREASDEVRRVAGQIEGSVTGLAQMSTEGRERTVVLSQSARSSATTVNDIVKSVERSANISKSILGNIQGQQSAVIGIMDLMPAISSKSSQIRIFTHRLLTAVQKLEKAVLNLSRGAESVRPEEKEAETEEEKEPVLRSFPYIPERLIDWRRLGLRLVAANRELPQHERRQSRLLNIMCLFLIFALIIYLPVQEVINPRRAILFSVMVTLVGVILAYTVNKFASYFWGLFLFFGAWLVGFAIYFQLASDQTQIVDYVKIGATVPCLLIMVAVIIGGGRSIIYTTGMALLLIILFSFQRVERSFLEMLPLIAFPVVLLAALGLLASFLHNNIIRLNEQLVIQNQRLTANNRELLIKERQEKELSQLINNLASELQSSFEEQAQLATSQLQAIQEITSRVENLERGARQLVSATQQIGQAARDAQQHAQQGATSIENGMRIIEEFQGRVAQISNNSQELEGQASEIRQTFDLIIDLAEEIDLLALNATVEASQAQEAGKRFAAVASEVQHLAGRARVASATVRQVVDRVQQAVELCVELTERGQNEIKLLSHAAQDTSTSIQEIVEIVSNTSSLISQITDAIQQQAEAIGQVLDRLRAIAKVGQVFKDNTSASSETVTRLHAVAGHLTSMTQELETELITAH
jgi:methyl-accepting chemotaxis protein